MPFFYKKNVNFLILRNYSINYDKKYSIKQIIDSNEKWFYKCR